MNYRQQAAREFADRIKALGFRVWLAERGTYGVISDDTGARVLSFSAEDAGSLGGNYGPPSRESGTGWRLDQGPHDLRTAEDVQKALNAHPPAFCGKGWRYLATVAQHFESYPASNYVEV